MKRAGWLDGLFPATDIVRAMFGATAPNLGPPTSAE